MKDALEVLHMMRRGLWNEAHNLIQRFSSPEAAWLHGLLHIQEGDLEDAEYWYGVAGRHFRSRGTLSEEMDALNAHLMGIHKDAPSN
ncbi:hypothetical protein [Pectobacterium aroidearum]|uniref:hypothetical protein n=1 Tax=Pectobacterium aroidearum TaxID=1201031 RepID=UPI0032F08480